MADYVYVAVTNIPSDYHAADLRDHFSALVESKSFLCFHYRHRPEKSSASGTEDSMSSTERLNVNCKKTKRCCVVKVAKAKVQNMLQYNETNWTGADGEISEVLCNVSAISLATQESITGILKFVS
ncbi:G patch domain-containing protein 3 [Plakobranchus ocellatus]|uniref:G patch domain-containing protein 3 n=1 Tax=Plakobranchus ocellatus TaxID=259542 RepID=A0AAV3Z4Q8_9GAST|nr:G patch domain-containing protein 3 [Plakobranchus ocellatus]